MECIISHNPSAVIKIVEHWFSAFKATDSEFKKFENTSLKMLSQSQAIQMNTSYSPYKKHLTSASPT